MVAISSSNLGDTSYWKSSDSEEGSAIPPSQIFSKLHSTQSKRFSMSALKDESRFILWVDAVGGFLVCPRQEVTIGQAIADSRVDIPILGDLARRHLKIIRNPEGYLLQPFGYVKLNGVECQAAKQSSNSSSESELSEATLTDRDSAENSDESFSKILLRHGDVLELTGGIQIKFSKPHPLSATARLDFQSPHRTQPWSDAVLLMAESCVFGPNKRNHVICRHWKDDLVFFQQRGQLFCKSLEPINVDGTPADGKQELTRNSHIEGEDFSMTIEPLTS